VSQYPWTRKSNKHIYGNYDLESRIYLLKTIQTGAARDLVWPRKCPVSSILFSPKRCSMRPQKNSCFACRKNRNTLPSRQVEQWGKHRRVLKISETTRLFGCCTSSRRLLMARKLDRLPRVPCLVCLKQTDLVDLQSTEVDEIHVFLRVRN